MSWPLESDAHAHFQMDLSCMLDGELDESAAARAMLHIEECDACRNFFEDIRLQVRAHGDATDPDRLFARVSMLTGAALREEAAGIDLVHRLATVFYQLGKAYVLSAIDPDFRTRVFESAVKIDEVQTRGRGFVDGVVMAGNGAAGGLDWSEARHMLNGRLAKIETPLEKGRRLLEEAVEADENHEESALYLAFLHAHEGRTLKAADEYRRVFDTALSEENRGHAAMQLGRLYAGEGDYHRALVCFRWISISGLSRVDERFYGARFNAGKCYAMLGQKERALVAFRALLDEHPGHVGEVARLFAGAVKMQQAIESIPGFLEELVAQCPELFQAQPELPK